jgi:hypothetical protein
VKRARLAGAVACFAGLVALPACEAKRPSGAAFDADSVAEGFAASTAALMCPGASRAFQVEPGGDLFNGEWAVRLRASEVAGPAGPPRVVAYERRWLPVAHWTRRGPHVRWDFEAVARPIGPPADTALYVSLAVSAVNLDRVSEDANLDIVLEYPTARPPFTVFDAAEPPRPSLHWAGSGDGVAWGWSEAPASGDRVRVHWSLAPGERRGTRVVLPSEAVSARTLRGLARDGHDREVTTARREWTETLGRGTRFALRDSAVEDAVRGAEVVLLSCRERRGRLWVPIGNPFQYRDVWLRDGARAVSALAVAGFVGEARDLTRGLLQFQWPQGPFLSQRGQLDGTGQALWAFEQAWLRGSPPDSIAEYADAARRAWRWNEWQRDLGRRSGWPFGTMMPFGDPRDGELVRAQLVGNDAWMLAGYRAASRLLRAAGRNDDAAAVESSAALYGADFARSLSASGARDVPPSWQGVGRDWGNVAVAWPCMALPARDPRCAAFAERLWATSGDGLVTYGTRDSLHGYLGADLGTWAQLAGRRDDADRALDALLRWRSASGGGAEIFTREGDYGTNLPPHATTAAALVALVRNSLVFDDDDTLRLTLGARERWWSGTSVERAPTRWGTLDLAFRATSARAEWHWTAVPVWTALRLPPHMRLARELPAGLRAGRTPDEILAPPGAKEASVAIVAQVAPGR